MGGQLCQDQGKAVVNCMGSTIMYTVNPYCKTDVYNLKILTVVTEISSCSALPQNMMCPIGDGETSRKGIAGHVVLTYAKGGGQLITSMGHWIELQRIDTNLESVMRVAAHEFGDDERQEIEREYRSQTTDAERAAFVQQQAQTMVQKSMPS